MMQKVKFIAILSVLSLVGIILSSSNPSVTSAQTKDVLDEIAEYKTWTRINKEPIKATINLDPDFAGG